jgi:WD40 repeat protein
MAATPSTAQQLFRQDAKATNPSSQLKPPIEVIVNSQINSILVSASGDIVIGLQHGGILVVDAETGKYQYKHSGKVPIDESEFSDDECPESYYEVRVEYQFRMITELKPNVVCAASCNEIRILDLTQDQCLQSLTSLRRNGKITVVPTTTGNIFVASMADKTIRIENPETGALLRSIVPSTSTGLFSLFKSKEEDLGNISSATRLPNGEIVCGTTQGFIFTLDPESGRLKNSFKGYEGEKPRHSGPDWCQHDSKRINKLALLPNNDLVTGSENGPLYIREQSTGKIKDRLVTGNKDNFRVSDLKIDNHHIVCLSGSVLYIWDGQTGAFLKEVTGLRTNLHDFAITHDGEILISDFPGINTKCHIYRLPLSYVLAHEQQSIPFRSIPFPKEPIVTECQPICDSSDGSSLRA